MRSGKRLGKTMSGDLGGEENFISHIGMSMNCQTPDTTHMHTHTHTHTQSQFSFSENPRGHSMFLKPPSLLIQYQHMSLKV